jgi:hypothetical protein
MKERIKLQPTVRLTIVDGQYFIEQIPIQIECDSNVCGYRIINFISTTGRRRSFRVNWYSKNRPIKKGLYGIILRK